MYRLRKGGQSEDLVVKRDFENNVDKYGSTIVFEWEETVGGTYDETYETWVGGTVTPLSTEVKGLGRVLDYKEDMNDVDNVRLAVGDCIARFPVSFDLKQFADKEKVRFIFNGQRWKIDSDLDWADYFSDTMISKNVKGVKSND